MKALDDGKADHSALSREVLKIKREVLSIPGLAHPKGADAEPPLPRRSQIVRMYQTGIEPNQIAALLCTPIREVELAISANRWREGAGAIVK
jgi:hypothetical protein